MWKKDRDVGAVLEFIMGLSAYFERPHPISYR